MARNDRSIIVEDARIVFRNFAGVEGPYNRAGDRNFSLVLDDVMADTLEADGWNVKHRAPREEGDTPLHHLPVSVNFRGRPPTVVMITSRGRTNLSEDEVELLDYADLKNVDLIVRPYDWNVNGKTGVKAYLEAIYVTIHEDRLALKYAEVPDANPPRSDEA